MKVYFKIINIRRGFYVFLGVLIFVGIVEWEWWEKWRVEGEGEDLFFKVELFLVVVVVVTLLVGRVIGFSLFCLNVRF